MTDSGFRPYPGEEIVAKWEEMGGRWQQIPVWSRTPRVLPVGGGTPVAAFNDSLAQWTNPLGDWRPIHPDHGWNHYPWMWAELTGEDMTPTGEGWYWWTGLSREDYQISWRPVEVYEHADHGLLADGGIGDEERPVWVGKWGGPVEGMPGEVGR